MPSCGSCKSPFLPGDEIDLAGIALPPAIMALKPLAREHISRLLLFRCPSPGCGGMVTALYLPRTPSVERRAALV